MVFKIVPTEWFSREGGDGITAKRPLIDSAFTEDVLLEGLNSEVVEADTDTLVALRLLEHRVPQQKPLTEVSDEIKQILLNSDTKKLAAKARPKRSSRLCSPATKRWLKLRLSRDCRWTNIKVFHVLEVTAYQLHC